MKAVIHCNSGPKPLQGAKLEKCFETASIGALLLICNKAPPMECDDWQPEAGTVSVTHAGMAFDGGVVKTACAQFFDVRTKMGM